MENVPDRVRGDSQVPSNAQLLTCCMLAATCVLLQAATATAAPRVQLELVTEEGFPASGSHRWMSALQNLGLANLRIRSARPGDKVQIVQDGSGSTASYRVTGLLTADNLLLLPGGRFRLGDIEGLRAWIGKLQEGGETRLHETEAAFGLTPTQLVAVHEVLSRPLTVATKGQRSFDVLKQISAGLTLSFLAGAEARAAMGGDDPVLDELQGLSSGTAIAAILRPLGLVLVPQKQSDGEIRLWITDARRARESWPVGWPSDRSPRETLPALFNFLNIEIDDTPLQDALAAIGGRLEAPLLFDHNSLARQKIAPAEVKVSLQPRRMYYQAVLDRLLNQAGLTNELRVDDAGKPFLWISTLRRG